MSPLSPLKESLRIHLDDVDAAGVAFGPRLIMLAHRAAETILARHGLDIAVILRAGRIALPLVRIETDFRAPLRHGDSVVADLVCRRIGTSSVTLATRLCAGSTVACEVVQIHACIDARTHQTIPLPDDLRAALLPLMPLAG